MLLITLPLLIPNTNTYLRTYTHNKYFHVLLPHTYTYCTGSTTTILLSTSKPVCGSYLLTFLPLKKSAKLVAMSSEAYLHVVMLEVIVQSHWTLSFQFHHMKHSRTYHYIRHTTPLPNYHLLCPCHHNMFLIVFFVSLYSFLYFQDNFYEKISDRRCEHVGINSIKETTMSWEESTTVLYFRVPFHHGSRKISNKSHKR